MIVSCLTLYGILHKIPNFIIPSCALDIMIYYMSLCNAIHPSVYPSIQHQTPPSNFQNETKKPTIHIVVCGIFFIILYSPFHCIYLSIFFEAKRYLVYIVC